MPSNSKSCATVEAVFLFVSLYKEDVHCGKKTPSNSRLAVRELLRTAYPREHLYLFKITPQLFFLDAAKVASLPLVMYEFKYDSVKGRRQLGSVGPGLEEVIPESVEVHAKSTYPSLNKVSIALPLPSLQRKNE